MSEIEADTGIRPGDLLAGKYRVSRVLGTGAMGVVVAAEHVQLETKVAIKLLLPALRGNLEATKRFERESRSVAKLTNEHVARVLDVGETGDGLPYFVMEYLEGEDLAAMLARAGRLEVELAVEFVLHACVALAEAHGLGIVHRDLKPANLFCIRRPDGQLSVKLLDFGISKVSTAEEGVAEAIARLSLTKNLEAMGSPLYMSPEQMKSAKHADQQSDIWALGVILFQLLSNDLPFLGESETDVAVQVSTQPPRSLLARRPDLPPALEAVILKCLEKDRARRYANVADLACDLAPFAPARAWGAVERITGTVETSRLAAVARASGPEMVEVPIELDDPAVAGGDESRNATTLLGHTTRGSGMRPASSRTGWLVAFGVSAGVLVALGLLFLRPQPPKSDREAAAGAAATGAVQPVVVPVPSAAEPVPVEPATLAPEATSPAAPAMSAAVPPAPASPHKGRSTPAVAKPQAGSPPCDPPYTLDDDGRKHFKPECFLKN